MLSSGLMIQADVSILSSFLVVCSIGMAGEGLQTW